MRKSDFTFASLHLLTSLRSGANVHHEDKITFLLEYRTQFFDTTTCGKLNLGHAFLLERMQNPALRTECEKSFFLPAAYKLRFKLKKNVKNNTCVTKNMVCTKG